MGKKDENGFYLAINGKKYPIPQNMNWKQLSNNIQFREKLFRNKMGDWDDYSQIVGSGGGLDGRNLLVYVCDNGYQHHLISIFCFMHRDRRKDGILAK